MVQSPEWPGHYAQSMPSLSGGWGKQNWEQRTAQGLRAQNKASYQFRVQGSFRHCVGGPLPGWCQHEFCPHLPRTSFPFSLLPQKGRLSHPQTSQGPSPSPTPTSGWNCCSVRVWQYWQASPFSHLPGSPHSSPCFTLGHGDDLVQLDGGVRGMKDRERLRAGECQLDACSGSLSGLRASQGQAHKEKR